MTAARWTLALPLAMIVGLTITGQAEALYPTSGGRSDRGVKVVAAGDIACPPAAAKADRQCRQGATARLARRMHPAAVLTLGDLQYSRGDIDEFRGSYARSWGRLRPRTYPTPGNHEYETPGAAGYYRYFRKRQPGPPGWYAYRLGAWRLYSLNSECGAVNCDAERRWLHRDLRRHRRQCSLMYMHEPRYSSGTAHGGTTKVQGLWRVAYKQGVDVALAGHEHNYERFRRLDHRGRTVADGIVSFVVGTGGRSLYNLGDARHGSVVRYNEAFGVLALRLRDGSYRWQFKTIGRNVIDRGSHRCA